MLIWMIRQTLQASALMLQEMAKMAFSVSTYTYEQ